MGGSDDPRRVHFQSPEYLVSVGFAKEKHDLR